MEYTVFVIGIIAFIVSVVINGKISKRSEEEIKVLKAELKSYIETDTNARFISNNAYFEGKYNALNQKINETIVKKQDEIADIKNLDSNLGEIEHDLDDAVDRIDNIESEIKKLQDDIDIRVYNSQWIEEDYATYLENDSSVLRHIESAGYDINNIIIFMAYMLQDLKDKVYGKKIVTHEEPKTKTNTRRKKVSVSGDTNDTTTGSEVTKI